MVVHKWRDIKKRSKLSPRRIAEIEREAEQEIIEGDLRALRAVAGKTQSEVAKLIEKTQGELSRMERRSDHRLSTLKKLVEALGGELEVIAHVGSKRVKLRGV
jgi:predicted transcriptional regulator